MNILALGGRVFEKFDKVARKLARLPLLLGAQNVKLFFTGKSNSKSNGDVLFNFEKC